MTTSPTIAPTVPLCGRRLLTGSFTATTAVEEDV